MWYGGSRNRGSRWKDEGGSPLPWRPFIDAVGSGISASDDAALARTLISVSGGGSVDWAAMGIYRPQDYGTVDPTGAADSATAIQAAITAMTASNCGGTVLLPPGRFKIGTGLTMQAPTYDATHGWGYRYGMKICGQVFGATALEAASGLTAPVLSVEGEASGTAGFPPVDILDLAFNGNAQTGLTNGVLRLNKIAQARIQRVVVMGAIGGSTLAPLAIKALDVIYSTWDQVYALNAGIGFYFTQAPWFTNGFVKMDQCSANGCATTALDFEGIQLTMNGFDAEGGANSALVKIRDGNLLFQGPIHYEGAGSPYHFDLTCNQARILATAVRPDALNIRNRGTTDLVVVDNAGVAVTQDAGAKTRLERCPGYSVTGGTTTVYH